MTAPLPALLVVAGYLSGSIPFGVILTRLFRGVDVRASGSGNIGATNVARVAGKKLGVVVLLLDAVKGSIPVLVAVHLYPEWYRLHAFVGLAAFLGHVYPIWLKLHGGKGVATALGVLLVLVPYAALCGFVAYAAIFGAKRVSSIGSLAGGLTCVAAAFVMYAMFGRPLEYALLALLLMVLMVYTHRSNIQRILRRTESRL